MGTEGDRETEVSSAGETQWQTSAWTGASWDRL